MIPSYGPVRAAAMGLIEAEVRKPALLGLLLCPHDLICFSVTGSFRTRSVYWRRRHRRTDDSACRCHLPPGRKLPCNFHRLRCMFCSAVYLANKETKNGLGPFDRERVDFGGYNKGGECKSLDAHSVRGRISGSYDRPIEHLSFSLTCITTGIHLGTRPTRAT